MPQVNMRAVLGGNMTFKKIFITILSISLITITLACAGSKEKQKKLARATRELGEAYMQQGNYTEALKELLKAEKLYANDHLLQNDLGLVYMAKERLDKAESHFKKAIDIKEEYAPAKNNLGTVYMVKEDWDAAIAQFKTVAGDVLYATPHFPLTNMGFAYYKTKDYKNAEKYYLEALDLEPDFVLALKGLAKTYMATNRIDQSVKFLEKAVKHAPESAELYLELGNAYHMGGESQKALYAYKRVLSLSPDSPLSESAQKEILKIENRP